MITHGQFIDLVRPYFVRDGRPTIIVRKMHETDGGRLLCAALFNYYVNSREAPEYHTWKLETGIDIENHRVELGLVDRLRKVGM